MMTMQDTAQNANTSADVPLDFESAAQQWFADGFNVIPIYPLSKKPAVTWDDWLEKLDQYAISSYWQQNPDHEVACIVGDELIVYDADSPEAITAFENLLVKEGTTCDLTVKTRKGMHYYFKRAPGTTAKSDSHDTTTHPCRLDVKTGRGMIVLPPSTGKTIAVRRAKTASDLSEARQGFIDAVSVHNGRHNLPTNVKTAQTPSANRDKVLEQIAILLPSLDPDFGYDDWLAVGMAIHHETRGSEDGFTLFHDWSMQGAKYKDRRELETKWRSFTNGAGSPLTMGSLRHKAIDAGVAPEALCQALNNPTAALPPDEHPLRPHTLQGKSQQFELESMAHKLFLGRLAVLGQWTVIYAPPNTGKTLLVLSLLIQGIKDQVFEPDNLYYINADDNHEGLTAKLKLAESHGFHMLAPGYEGFRSQDLQAKLQLLADMDNAREIIVVLDTLKKFADLMDKRESTSFGNVAREFTAKGGTILTLAHVNKNRGYDGSLIHAGTSDIKDDCDCAYMLDIMEDADDRRTVEFTNEKNRGSVANKAGYRYSIAEGQTYQGLLDSVEAVDAAELAQLRESKERFDLGEVPIIDGITQILSDEPTAKTALKEQVVARLGVSQRQVLSVIEKYSGSDPKLHHWQYTVGDRGVKMYAMLLSDSSPLPDTADL
ncbi:hypothetical protein EYC98_21285 [Halieaceae bacterium IMCC14734]|uniref:DNA primase/polymerase bifunctional N-terminal domain-containing protein n=1 Tax=Candidatus Litorirhabdus singularis TaxID=2518993 RepID=A0ABT3TNU6_9GAMM|nr:PriCT-2 domain-containing protein [Candidatus Litorirhabdus singularis]MCX2983401.1 hypothetical protein [Candidatus Litorirhabdus singularis]